MRGTIVIKNIEFQAYHGATAAERRSLRRFQLDVTLRVDMTRSMQSDRLSDTINYQEISQLVVDLATAKTFRLLEALAGALLDAISARWPHAEVQIDLRKLHPPCMGNPDFAQVTLGRLAEQPD